jgi:hypothetical protein
VRMELVLLVVSDNFGYNFIGEQPPSLHNKSEHLNRLRFKFKYGFLGGDERCGRLSSGTTIVILRKLEFPA